MYYYILEQTLEQKNKRFRERLTDWTTDLGIAGEMVTVSSLKSIDELLAIGLRKGYTTIVAVGSDGHVNRTISSLMRWPAADRPAFGVVPTDPKSLVGLLVETPDVPAALRALKARKLAYASLLEIDPHRYILTQAAIRATKPTRFELEIDQAHIEIPATEILVAGDGQIEVRNTGSTGAQLKRGLAWFIGATLPDRETSLLRGDRIRIDATEQLPLVLNGEVLAKTPVLCKLSRRALKIIVARATVSPASN